MTTWSDLFTHDYFGDSTYTIVSGVEGTDFSLGVISGHPGINIATSTGVAWQDRHLAALSAISMYGGLETSATPLGQITMGLLDATQTNGFAYTANWTTGVTTLTAHDSTVSGHTFTLTGTIGNPGGAGSADITFTVFPNGVLYGIAQGQGSGSFSGVGNGLVGIPDNTVLAALAARTLHPYMSIGGSTNVPLMIQPWTYTDFVAGVSDWQYSSSPFPPLPDPFVLRWTYGPQSGQTDQFDFNGRISQPGSYPIIKWLWTLSDGSTYQTPTFTHVFPGNGEYLVTLEVVDAIGNISTTSKIVTVADQTSGPTPVPTSIVAPTAVLNLSAPAPFAGSLAATTYITDGDNDPLYPTASPFWFNAGGGWYVFNDTTWPIYEPGDVNGNWPHDDTGLGAPYYSGKQNLHYQDYRFILLHWDLTGYYQDPYIGNPSGQIIDAGAYWYGEWNGVDHWSANYFDAMLAGFPAIGSTTILRRTGQDESTNVGHRISTISLTVPVFFSGAFSALTRSQLRSMMWVEFYS